ncbi:signal peptide peptidase SppA [Candidatus Cyanaurora vandensis]|uniref:signal peptide peptidase SppA n=1 Tax=Candidatus Cyanaurora vandensis TaxID=2714958 RepID=UPI00257A171B|nr:signal peptide peptidase SppA [Candidatus Cyanaurora vandensis]
MPGPRWPYVVIALLLLLPVLVVGGLFLALGNREPEVAQAALLELNLNSDLPEFVPGGGSPLDLLAGDTPLTLKDQLDNLKKAAEDDRIKGVLVRLDDYGAGWAKTEELRDALTLFKRSGKFTVGYAQSLDERGYYLALVLDELYMVPEGSFEMNGLVSQAVHLPGLLERLGIGVQYFAFGQYKSQSGQSFGLKAFTPPVKEMINYNLDGRYNRFVNAVAQGKKLTIPQVRRLIDTNLPTTEWALANRLITGIAYEDELRDKLKKKLGQEPDADLAQVQDGSYHTLPLGKFGLNGGEDKIGLVYSVGLIVPGAGDGASPLTGDTTQGSQPIVDALRKAGEDDEIKAVVFRVDSPGGAGIGPDLVRREVERLKAKKPVIVSMSDSAASGGYWVAMDATAIVAQPSTTTGSIGVFSVIPNLQQLNQRLDLTPEVFKRGARADALSGTRPLDATEARLYNEQLYKFYRRFVDLAAKGRGKTAAEMEAVAQGRSWLGDRALTLGLVDRLGGLDTAIGLAREKAKIPNDRSVQVVELQTPSNVWDNLGGFFTRLQQAQTRQLARELLTASGTEPLFRGWGALTPELVRKHRYLTIALPEDVH